MFFYLDTTSGFPNKVFIFSSVSLEILLLAIKNFYRINDTQKREYS